MEYPWVMASWPAAPVSSRQVVLQVPQLQNTWCQERVEIAGETVTDYCHSPGDCWEIKTVNYLQVCNAAKPSSFFQVCSICQEIIAVCSKQEKKVAQNSWKDVFVAKVPMKLRGLKK